MVSTPPILLTHRLKTGSPHKPLILELTAEERTRLRGHRKTTCGQEVLLQLPREGPLIQFDLLVGEESSPQVLVKAAIEDLLQVRARTELELIKATYHLGNRHVALELNLKELYLLEDSVLERMLKKRGLKVQKVRKTFFPELGAYSEIDSHPNHA